MAHVKHIFFPEARYQVLFIWTGLQEQLIKSKLIHCHKSMEYEYILQLSY